MHFAGVPCFRRKVAAELVRLKPGWMLPLTELGVYWQNAGVGERAVIKPGNVSGLEGFAYKVRDHFALCRNRPFLPFTCDNICFFK